MEGFWPQQASKGEFVWPKNQPTIRLFILHNYVSGGHIGITGKCVGKVTAAPGVWQEPSGKTTNGGSALLHLDTSLCLFLSPIYSFSHGLLFFCRLSSTPSSRHVVFLSASPHFFFRLPLSCLSYSTSLSLFVISYWPWFPFSLLAWWQSNHSQTPLLVISFISLPASALILWSVNTLLQHSPLLSSLLPSRCTFPKCILMVLPFPPDTERNDLKKKEVILKKMPQALHWTKETLFSSSLWLQWSIWIGQQSWHKLTNPPYINMHKYKENRFVYPCTVTTRGSIKW